MIAISLRMKASFRLYVLDFATGLGLVLACDLYIPPSVQLELKWDWDVCVDLELPFFSVCANPPAFSSLHHQLVGIPL